MGGGVLKKSSKSWRSPLWTMRQISSIPELTASSIITMIAGLALPSRSTIGNNSFLTTLDAGNKRVPNPAAGITAFLTRCSA